MPRKNGEKRRQKCVRIGEMTKAEAQKRERELIRQYDTGEVADDRDLTVSNLLETWLEQNAPSLTSETTLSPTTYQRYQSIVRLHLIPGLGHIRLSKLTASHVAETYRSLRESGLSGQTCLHVHRVFHRALNYGIRPLHLIAKNVAAEVPAPRPTDRTMAPMKREGIQVLLEVAKGTRLETPVALAALTGLRRGEILALRWDGIDFKRRLLAVNESLEQTHTFGLRFKSPKSRSSRRVIPLAEETAAILKAHKAKQERERERFGRDYLDQDLVFCNPDGSPWPPDTLTQQFSAMAKSVGMKGFRFHDLRHAFASLMLKDGGSVKEASILLGHSSPVLTLSVYAQQVEGMGREAVSKLARSLLSA